MIIACSPQNMLDFTTMVNHNSSAWFPYPSQARLTEFTFYVLLDTEWVISEKFFSAHLLASTEKIKMKKLREITTKINLR